LGISGFGSVNCEEEWGFGGLRPAKEWGFADLGVCPTLPSAGLRPGTCDAKRRTGVWRRPKGIRVSGLLNSLNLLEKAELNLLYFNVLSFFFFFFRFKKKKKKKKP
jgi:hypothetical protein